MTFKKKMSKRTDSKRTELPGLSSENVDEIRQSFELFDSSVTGKLDSKELRAEM